MEYPYGHNSPRDHQRYQALACLIPEDPIGCSERGLAAFRALIGLSFATRQDLAGAPARCYRGDYAWALP
jgi:hypothetical protein